jgi:hypothetical protein
MLSSLDEAICCHHLLHRDHDQFHGGERRPGISAGALLRSVGQRRRIAGSRL